MKLIKRIMAFLIISMFLTSTFTFANDKYSKDISMNDTFIIATENIDEESEFFKSNISYPILKIKNTYINKEGYNKEIIENINKQISTDILNFKERIKNESEKYKKQYEELYSKQNNDYVKYQYEAYSNYKVAYNKNNYLSIPIKTYEFTGGAHGMTYLKSYNYDLLTGKEFKLKDMFKKDVDYKKIANDFINAQISKNPNMYFEGKDGFKGISDNQEFYIDEDGVVIYFQLYDIAPYYVGIPEFKMTWSEFGKYFK